MYILNLIFVLIIYTIDVPSIPLWLNAVNYGPGHEPYYKGQESLQSLIMKGNKTIIRDNPKYKLLTDIITEYLLIYY